MSVSVTMPRLGESVSEGTVTRWLKKEGERVEADEPLLEVSTDKVDTEIPAPASGVLQSIKVAEDETVDVGVELAVISDGEGGGAAPAQEEPAEQQPPAEEAAPPQQREEVAAEAAPEPEPEPEPAPTPEPQTAQAPAPQAASPSQPPAEPSGDGGGDASYVTPLVRRLAAEQGVDLAQVSGTGVGGRIRKQDVLDAARAGGARPSPSAAPAASPSAPRATAPAQTPTTPA